MKKKKIENNNVVISSNMASQNILIIVPVYNEGTRILRVVEGIRQAGFDRILVIDDGSSDNTQETLAQTEVKYIRHTINRGQGAAIQTGFEIALEEEVDFVIAIDGDDIPPKGGDGVVKYMRMPRKYVEDVSCVHTLCYTTYYRFRRVYFW